MNTDLDQFLNFILENFQLTFIFSLFVFFLPVLLCLYLSLSLSLDLLAFFVVCFSLFIFLPCFPKIFEATYRDAYGTIY